MERLQKILSRAGIASRRASEALMLEGRVTVNGTTIRELGTRADPLRDEIRVDGRRIRLPERHRYVLLNKPSGFVTTRSDPERRPTVLNLVGLAEYLYPVGRLDYDTEGLLLLTNDGDLAARLTHPRHGVPRVYEARVAGVPDERDLRQLAKGLVIDGRRTQPAQRRAGWTRPPHHDPGGAQQAGAADVRGHRPPGRSPHARRHRAAARLAVEAGPMAGPDARRGGAPQAGGRRRTPIT